MCATLKKFCFWHFFEKKKQKNVSKTKTILLAFHKCFLNKTFSFFLIFIFVSETLLVMFANYDIFVSKTKTILFSF